MSVLDDLRFRRNLTRWHFQLRRFMAQQERRMRMNMVFDTAHQSSATATMPRPQACGSRFAHRRREFEAAMQAAERRLGGQAPDELTVTYDPITGVCAATIGEELIYQTPINLRLPLAAPENPDEASRLVGQLAQQIVAQRGQIHRLNLQLAKSRVLVRQAFELVGEGA
jgi:hypothetical protein